MEINLCPMCFSSNTQKFNSYKHLCFSCGDCNSIFHEKKTKPYLIEYIFPRIIAKRILPEKAFLRLFHASNDYNPSSFYEVYSEECTAPNPIRRSEVSELLDNFALIGEDFKGKAVLDISGGPGLIVKELSAIARRAVVTEYDARATEAMQSVLGIEALKFDYKIDNLSDIVQEKYDVVLLRSSIIFCDNLDKLLRSINSVLNDDGFVLVETITPSLGEVFWWQQMEYKFPVIYSQEFIEKIFYKHGYTLKIVHREYGDYIKNKWRRKTSLGRKMFTWFIDFPMMVFYYALAPKRKIPIDQKTHHKMLTQIWRKRRFSEFDAAPKYINSRIGDDIQSSHFTQVYNGWLRRFIDRT